MSADVQTGSAGASGASESVAAAAAPSSSVASAAAALAAASSASAASPKEERKVGKLNMAAFSNAGAGDSAAAADKGAAGPGGGKAVGKLGVKMQIPLFSPGKGPAGPGGNQTMPGAKRHSLTTGDSNGSDGGADASAAAAGTPSNGSSFGSGGGPGSMRGMGTAPGKLQANSLMNNLNAMLVGGPRKPRSGSISGEDGAAQGQQVAASAVAEENKDGSNEPAPTITHAKRARVNRKARTKPTELAKAGITTGFTAVEISQSKVAAITLISVVKEAAPAEAAPTAVASEEDASASAAQPQEAAVSGATTLDGSSSEADSNDAAAAAPAVAAAVAAAPSKPSPPNYPKPPPPRQPKPVEEEAQAEPAAAAAAAAAAESSAPIAAVPSSSSSSDSAPASSSSSSSSSSASSLAAPPTDASQRAAWSAASLYGDFVDPEFDENKADEYRLLTAAGGEFLKHGKSGKPHPRLVFVTSALMLLWTEPGKRSAKPDPKCSINLALASIPKIAVVKGKSTPNFQRSSAAKVDPSLCLSITAPRDRNLDLEARSQEERDAWYAAFKFLLNEAQLAREKALVYGAMH